MPSPTGLRRTLPHNTKPRMYYLKTLECAAQDNRRFLVDVFGTCRDPSSGRLFAFLRYPTVGPVSIVSQNSFRLPRTGELITRVSPRMEMLSRDKTWPKSPLTNANN